MFCGQQTLIIEGPGVDEGRRLRCRCWHCPDCNPIRLYELKQKAKSGHPQVFITLTVSTTVWPDPDEGAQQLVKAWRYVLKRAKREGIINDIEYFCVFEQTERGYPHLHILARCKYLPADWLSARMDEYMQSPIVKVKAVDNREGISGYLSKYISKGPHPFEGCKRYWSSQGYQIDPLDDGKGIPVADHRQTFSTRPPEAWADAYMRKGWQVEWEDWWSFMAFDYGYSRPTLNFERECLNGGPARGPPRNIGQPQC